MITYFIIGIFWSAFLQFVFAVFANKTSLMGFIIDAVFWPLSIISGIYLIYREYNK